MAVLACKTVRAGYACGVITIRTFVNNSEAWLARSLLESEGIRAEVADDNMNAGYASLALNARLQVAVEDRERAIEVLDRHEAFTPLPDDFVPPESGAIVAEEESMEKPPSLARQWGPAAFFALVTLAVAAALFMWLAPLSWLYDESELVRAGNTAADKKDYDTALKYYNAALASKPSSGPAHFDRGLVYYYKGKYAEAIADFSEDVKVRPDHRPAYSMRARSYVKTTQPDLALADFNKAIWLDPGREVGYRDRGVLYNNLEQWEKAIDDFNTAISKDPDDYLAYNHRAYANHRRGMNDDALADANEALRIKPENAASYVTRALAYAGKEDYSAALADFEVALRRDPTDPVTWVDRSFVFCKIGEYGKALEDANKSIGIEPNYSNGWLNRGTAYAKLGDAPEAIADCKRALELAPEKWVGHQELAWIYATTPQAASRDGRKAMELATKACNLSQWKEYQCIGALAAAEAETGRFDDAVKHATQALAMGQDDKNLGKRGRAEMADALKAYQQRLPYRDPAK